jgi:hypothetical protein
MHSPADLLARLMVYLGGNPDLVQCENQEDGCEELRVPHVHFEEGAGEGKGPHRWFRSGSSMGHPRVNDPMLGSHTLPLLTCLQW